MLPFVVIGSMFYHDGLPFSLYLFIFFSIPVCITDIRSRRIPLWCVYSGTGVLFLTSFFLFPSQAGNLLLGMLSGPVVFMAVRLFTKGKLGMGDVTFAAFTGVFNGFPGWFIATGLASLFGLLFAAAGMLAGRLDRNSRIPFAPFLTLGSVGAYFAVPILLRTIAGVPA